MKGKNAGPTRKSSAGPSRHDSLEPDPSFYLRRRKTNNADESEPVSPRFGATYPRPTNLSGGSNTSNLEVHSHSATSSLSLGREFPPNVSDWNEKFQRTTHPSSEDFAPRHSADPPRPAREGSEWVWFPEGYWAEREKPKSSLRKEKSRKWFYKPPERESNTSSPSKSQKWNKTPTAIDLPRIRIGSATSDGSTQAAEDESRTPDSPRSRIRRGLKYVSPTHPHFTSPTGQPEGLYCKVKRGIEEKVTNKPQMYLEHSAEANLAALPSTTTLLLEGTSSYLDRKQRERERKARNRAQLISTTPQTPASAEYRPRRGFGLAPWHRRTSQESILSVSSSVHRLLMGRAPVATPTSEKQKQYADKAGERHGKVEISEPGQPTFLPSEARRVKTPPLSAESSPRAPRGFFLDLSLPVTEEASSAASSSNLSTGKYSPRRNCSKEPRSPPGWWDNDDPMRAAAEKDLAKKHPLEVSMSLPPEHLTSSPPCPKNSMHKCKGREICVYHGRRKSESQRSEDGYDRHGQ